VGIELDQVPLNECMKEVCEGGCTNALTVSDTPTLTDSGAGSLIGVTARIVPKCGCEAESVPQRCAPTSCLHGGQCTFRADSNSTRYFSSMQYLEFPDMNITLAPNQQQIMFDHSIMIVVQKTSNLCIVCCASQSFIG